MDRTVAAAARHPVAIYGVIGFTLIVLQAIYRLIPLALEPIDDGMPGWHWALYGLSIVFNAYSEGYRAFQLQVAPRVVGRAVYLARHPRPLHIALAPLFCTGLLYATRRRLIITWSVYLGIVVLIIIVRQLPQPWRGMLDAGVVVGLSWGAAAILWLYGRALLGTAPDFDLDLPASAPQSPGESQSD